jgi:hypothetical protein
MDIRYARVSSQDQHPTLQLDALHAAGAPRYLSSRPPAPSAVARSCGGPGLCAAWRYAGGLEVGLPGAVAEAAHRDIERLAAREIGVRSLTEAIETTILVNPALDASLLAAGIAISIRVLGPFLEASMPRD